MKEKKNSERNHQNSNGGRISTRHGNTSRGGRRGRGRGLGQMHPTNSWEQSLCRKENRWLSIAEN
jgi:hypothetical protein